VTIRNAGNLCRIAARRSRDGIAAPPFLRPYLTGHLKDQTRRRTELGDRWHDTDLVVDRGDGDAVRRPSTLFGTGVDGS